MSALLLAFALESSSCGEDVVFDPDRAAHKFFSGARAYEHVEQQTMVGPRIAGSENLEITRQYIERILNESGWYVERQTFRQKTPLGEVGFVNLRARFSGNEGTVQEGDEKQRARIWARSVTGLVASHYETKKFEGFEFVGANDPGSSVGVLLEMA
ncbi:MAG: hypothetical protein GXP30_11500, partial [Verrucomicrobia bacterium]|nr:hypothetical protein [Verrucomicrobiota bacterium]